MGKRDRGSGVRKDRDDKKCRETNRYNSRHIHRYGDAVGGIKRKTPTTILPLDGVNIGSFSVSRVCVTGLCPLRYLCRRELTTRP